MRLSEVDVDPLQLEVAVAFIDACCINSMLFTYYFPKL